METKNIVVKGAREHNLADVSLTLPRNKLICFTGISGSGKSSMAFDTLYAEGQRRYVESLSAYARQFMGQLQKPDVDLISGLSPSISIQQKTSGWNPRSTVGTITQIHDYLRVLFARIGRQHCTKCGLPISAQSREQIVARIMDLPEKTRFLIMAPVVRGQKGAHRDLCDDLIRQGYIRARVDGQLVELTEERSLDRLVRHDIEVVVDRLVMKPDIRSRLAEAVEAALALGKGTLIVLIVDDPPAKGKKTVVPDAQKTPAETLYSANYACVKCGIGFEPPSPQLFSFNSPTGMCLECDGLGSRFDFDPDLMISDPNKSFLNGAVAPMRKRIGRWRRHIYKGVADHVGFDLKSKWRDLSKKARDALLYGTGDEHITFTWRSTWKHGGEFEGVIDELRAKYRKATARFVREYYEQFMRRADCEACGGARLNPQALAVRINGKNLHDVERMSISNAIAFVEGLDLTDTEQLIAEEVLKEVRGRLAFLLNVGLHYLALDRQAPSLSGGESQRIRLAGQIGAGLVGVLYILDEPSIGLHARDNRRLLDSLCRLRDMGNTVIVVEHDEETMRSADLIVDFGPGPGVRGGKVVAQGTLEQVKKTKASLTGNYLAGKTRIDVPATRRPVTGAPPISHPTAKPPARSASKRKAKTKTALK
jgi:excinuclease ABC subunit A